MVALWRTRRADRKRDRACSELRIVMVGRMLSKGSAVPKGCDLLASKRWNVRGCGFVEECAEVRRPEERREG